MARVHGVVGALAALPLILIALTGVALVFSDEMLLLGTSAGGAPGRALTASEASRAIERALRALETSAECELSSVWTLRLPRADFGLVRVWLSDGTQALIDTGSGRIVSRFAWHEHPATLLHELHVSLTLGAAGEQIVGGLGLVACGLLFSGLLALWRRRATLPVLRLWRPRSMRRGELTRAHGHWGLAASPLVLVSLLTGLGMTYHASARALLTTLAGGEGTTQPAPTASLCPSPEVVAAPAMAALATKEFPAAELVMVYPPRELAQPWGFRMRQPGESHPNGRTMVWIDACGGHVLAAEDALEAPLGERLVHALYPLHAAGYAGPLDDVLVLVTGVALAALIAIGAYARSRRRA